MTTYFDSSVVLRILLGARGALPSWEAVEHPVSSALMEVECLRTLDRLRLADNLAAREIAIRRQAAYDLISRIDIVALTSAVLARASLPLPVPLRTLDAIHLASAMLWRETEGGDRDRNPRRGDGVGGASDRLHGDRSLRAGIT